MKLRMWTNMAKAIALLALLAASAPRAAQALPVDENTTPGDHKLKFKERIDGKMVEMAYVLSLPVNYGKTRELHPLLMFLHGAGETGTDLAGVYVHGPLMNLQRNDMARFKASFPFIVLAPQCPPRGQRWDQVEMQKACVMLLAQVESQLQVDRDHVYVTGLSMGGKGTWFVSMMAPEAFAAIAPISADTVDESVRTKLQFMPTWMIAGGQDGGVVDANKKMFDFMQKDPVEVVRTVIPTEGHGVWTMFYENAQFYEWLLSHKRYSAYQKRELETYPQRIPGQPLAQVRTYGHHLVSYPAKVGQYDVNIRCNVFLPRTFSPVGAGRPMIVFLHESQVIGSLYNDMLLHGIDAALEKRGDEAFKGQFQAIVLSPQCPAAITHWDSPDMQAVLPGLIEEFAKQFHVDKTRIYLVGQDEGAVGGWALLQHSPGLFAAFSGVITQPNMTLAGAPDLKATPAHVMAAMNLIDPYKTLLAPGAPQSLATGETEAAMSNIYKNFEFYSWMYKHHRSAR
jgi:predicted peptidase